MKISPIFLVILVMTSCHCQQNERNTISKDEMLKIVKACDNQFSIGVQKKDSALLTNIYSDSAQYVIPKGRILKGKTEIGKDWGGFLRMKEKPIDLVLNISDVRGNRDIIYET